ncbi:sodium- and chloride-dependent glycine transporter 1-like [Amblyomma americanum]
MSPGIEHFGEFRMDLISYVGAVWLMVFFHLCGLAKFFGKVSLAVVPFCYACCMLVVIRMLLLDNAVEGLRYLFAVDWKAFVMPSVWHQAAQHSVFALGAWFGPLHYLSSRNDFFEDTSSSHVFLAINAVLCNVAGCVMTFSALGHVSALRGAVATPDVERPGQVVPFVTLPMVLGTFTLPRVASGCFFAAFSLQGLAAQLALVNGALQQLLADMDARLPSKKVFITFSYCLLCFLLSCFLASQNGFYIIHLLDAYVGGLAIPVVALYGIVAIVWIYGPHNISRDIKFLRGRPVSRASMLLWQFVCPAILILTALSPLATFSGVLKMGTYQYPLWANFMGSMTVVACLGIIAVVSMIVFRKYKRDIKEAVKPHSLWGPRDPALLEAYRKHQRSWRSRYRLRAAAHLNASMQKIGDLPEED